MFRLSQQAAVEIEPVRITLPQLEQALHAADPAAILLAPRILRRVVKEHAGVSGIGLRVPHRKTYVISQDALRSIVEWGELDLAPGMELAETVILIARPSPEQLSSTTAPEALTRIWRMLFHARVHQALDQQIAQGKLTPAIAQQRIAVIGATEFDEIRTVLKQEDFLLPPRDDLTTYVEFAAVYLELRHFTDGFLEWYFPAIDDYRRIDDLLRKDVDGAQIYASTRLPGITDAFIRGEATSEMTPLKRMEGRPAPAGKRNDRQYRRLTDKADRVAPLGNLVRAAILRTRAARFGGVELGRDARAAARLDLERLALRLREALEFPESELEEWTKSLVSLVDQSSRGIWTPEARLLYDLQKVCVDHERGVYALDLWRWILSRGRTPLKRLLPGQRVVQISKHLRIAASRLPAARISNRARSRLSSLLNSAQHRAENNLREEFRPVIGRALNRVKLVPHGLPEHVARRKLIDELLDRIIERNFLLMGDLRDALSRNNLKLPDLKSFKELVFTGDPLLRANRQLAATLDGVYRPGEIYLRFPQQLSSLAFGTVIGRFLTRFVALPYGGAFVIMEAVQHLYVKIAAAELPEGQTAPREWWFWWAVALLGSFLLGLLQHRGFRKACLNVVWRIGVDLRELVVDLPVRLYQLPVVKAVLGSWYFRLFRRYLFKPLVISSLVGLLMSLVLGWEASLESAGGIFVIVNVLLNSRLGRNVDEMVTDWLVHQWHRLRIHVFAAVVRMIMDVFNRILESVERMLYTVDEFLRFRSGESARATALKAVLGTVWKFVNYFIRIVVNVFIEPQINPIKHFPVVTVSHKIMIPFTGQLAGLLERGGLTKVGAGAAAGAIIVSTPGMFGFLVWELKENWRLYAANRPENLMPVSIGHHGETMVQFLRPGFRSGTIPKLYARIRRAKRKSLRTGNFKALGKHLTAIHGVEEGIRHFVDRELLELLKGSKGWDCATVTTGEIRLATNRILIELFCPDFEGNSLWLAFEEHAGWLVAAIHTRGWFDQLTPEQSYTLGNALAGFYKMAGADLVREQLEALLPPSVASYEITDQGLLVKHVGDSEPILYELRDWPPAEHPTTPQHFRSEAMRIDRIKLVFASAPISWHRWCMIWEMDQLDGDSKRRPTDGVWVLPKIKQ